MRVRDVVLVVIMSLGVASTWGLAAGVPERYYDRGTFTFTILGGCSLEVIGDYDFGTVDPFDIDPLSRSVTLRAWCNMDTYGIYVRAAGPVMMGGSPAAGITLANFEYTGPGGDAALTEADSLWFTGTRCVQRDHEAELQLANRSGAEPPGTYEATVVFTMMAGE